MISIINPVAGGLFLGPCLLSCYLKRIGPRKASLKNYLYPIEKVSGKVNSLRNISLLAVKFFN